MRASRWCILAGPASGTSADRRRLECTSLAARKRTRGTSGLASPTPTHSGLDVTASTAWYDPFPKPVPNRIRRAGKRGAPFHFPFCGSEMPRESSAKQQDIS